jgi:uncharacterized protein YkwD
LKLAMTVLCALLPLLVGCTSPEPAPVSRTPAIYESLASSSTKLDASAARDLINGYRRNQGLGALSLDPVLMGEADKQTRMMAAGGNVSAGARSDIKARLAASGTASRNARESVSAGYFTISDAFSGWRGSPDQDATLRFASAKRMGISAQHKPGSRHHVYWAIIVSE